MRDALRRVVVCLAAAAVLSCGGDSGGDGDGGAGGDGSNPPPGEPGVSDPFASAALEAHNAVRAAAQPAPSPALPPLGWSSTAAASAKARADTCTFGAPAAGENLSSSVPGATIAGIVQGWASQAAGYDHAANTCASPPLCSYYTKLVARATTAIGCAVATCPAPNPNPTAPPGPWELWVCHYEPPAEAGARPY